MPENSVAEPAEPVDEESQASSMHRSCAISCAERGTTGEVEVQAGADEELSPTHTETAKGDHREQYADEDGVDEGRSQPPEETARVDVERRADIDGDGEARP